MSSGNRIQSIIPPRLEKLYCCPGNVKGAELDGPLSGYVGFVGLFWGREYDYILKWKKVPKAE